MGIASICYDKYNTGQLSMKFIATIIFSAMLLCSNLALSDDKNIEGCENVEILAESIMTARQVGATKEKLLAATESSITDKNINEFQKALNVTAKNMIISAYEQPIYETEKSKKYAINSFKETWYLWCTKI
jgi:hypothetical protein